jgi:hypothetical protein
MTKDTTSFGYQIIEVAIAHRLSPVGYSAGTNISMTLDLGIGLPSTLRSWCPPKQDQWWVSTLAAEPTRYSIGEYLCCIV